MVPNSRLETHEVRTRRTKGRPTLAQRQEGKESEADPPETRALGP